MPIEPQQHAPALSAGHPFQLRTDQVGPVLRAAQSVAGTTSHHLSKTPTLIDVTAATAFEPSSDSQDGCSSCASLMFFVEVPCLMKKFMTAVTFGIKVFCRSQTNEEMGMRKNLLATLVASIGSLGGWSAHAEPAVMFGITHNFGGATGITLKVLSTRKQDKPALAAGVSYFPSVSGSPWGADIGLGYTFNRGAVTVGYDWLRSQYQMSLGVANTQSKSAPPPVMATPPAPVPAPAPKPKPKPKPKPAPAPAEPPPPPPDEGGGVTGPCGPAGPCGPVFF